MDNPVRIAVMGMTGAGKSTFIKTLIPEAEIAIGEDMNAQTIDPEAFMVVIDGTLYELVDTPGFGDTRRTDKEILRCISEYLAARHASGDLFHGIIYLHSLAHTRISGSMMAQIRAFKAICGNIFFSRLVIGSTFWEAITDLSVSLAYEEQLFSSDGYFEDVIDLGAQTTRVFQTREACLEAIQMIPRDEPLPLQIQLELDGDVEFNHTSAVAAVSPEQYQRQQEHEERMQQEQEAAERERLENERQASEEANRRVREYAAAESLRLRELARRRQEYEDQLRGWRAEVARIENLRRIASENAERKQRGAKHAAELKAEVEREAEKRRKALEEERRREKEQRARKLRELQAVEEEKQKKLRQIERSKEGYRNWHISWYRSTRICQGNNCSKWLRDGMSCRDCEYILCDWCYRQHNVLPHGVFCTYHDSKWRNVISTGAQVALAAYYILR